MSIYTCLYCNRAYQRKLYYNRHVLLCELISKSVKERQIENEERADTPSLRVLYDVILELTTKINKMDKQLQELSKLAELKKRKINILDWLNDTPMTNVNSSFEEFLLLIKIRRQHLDYLFRNDYTSTIIHILQEHLPLDNTKTNVIKAFEQKINVLYVCSNNEYEGNNSKKWDILSDKTFQNLIYVIDKKLLAEFICWQTENAANMVQDDFAIKYAENVKKMMGGNLTREQIYSRIKIDLYKYLKVCVKECEFV